MPSALERNGDFSQTRNNAGQLRFIRNPFSGLPCNVNSGGAGCFPGNVIPQNMIHPMGRQIMNLFPLPDPALVGNPVTQGNTTTSSQGTRRSCAATTSSASTGTSGRARRSTRGSRRARRSSAAASTNATAPALIAGAGMGFPWSNGSYDINTTGYVANLTHIFSPSTVLEIIGGTNWAEQDVYPLEQSDWDALDYRNHLPGHQQYFPENNPNHILPDMTFAGANALPNTRAITIGQGQAFPWLATNDAHNISVNLTHVRGTHNMKAGFFYERTGRPGALSSNAGTYNFNSDAANPLDTNLGWANATARAPQHLHREQQQPALHAGIQPARVLLPGQLARVASVHPRPRRPLLAHRRRLRQGSGHRLVRSRPPGVRRTRWSCGSRTAPTACSPAPARIGWRSIR